MKTSHLFILLILFWCLTIYVNNPLDINECFVGDINKKKDKMTKDVMNRIASGKSENNVNLNRFQKLFNDGKCTPFSAPKLKGLTKREILGRKLCYCPPYTGESVGNALILAKNMPNNACSKNDFTRT